MWHHHSCFWIDSGLCYEQFLTSFLGFWYQRARLRHLKRGGHPERLTTMLHVVLLSACFLSVDFSLCAASHWRVVRQILCKMVEVNKFLLWPILWMPIQCDVKRWHLPYNVNVTSLRRIRSHVSFVGLLCWAFLKRSFGQKRSPVVQILLGWIYQSLRSFVLTDSADSIAWSSHKIEIWIFFPSRNVYVENLSLFQKVSMSMTIPPGLAYICLLEPHIKYLFHV